MSNDSLECKICDEAFDTRPDRAQHRPKTLPCYHTFCAGCISRFPNHACPLDRKPFTLTAAGVAGLPDNYVAVDVLEKALAASAAAKKSEKLAAVSTPCCVCDAHADQQCVECEGDPFCAKCWLGHLRTRAGKDHHSVPVGSVNPVAANAAVTAAIMCPAHPALELKFFCTVDLCVFCAECFPTSDHFKNGHKVVPISDGIKSLADPNLTVCDAQRVALALGGGAKAVLAEATAVRAQEKSARAAIEAARTKLLATVNARCDALAGRVGAISDIKHKQLLAQSDALEMARGSLSSALQQIEFLLGKGASTIVLQHVKQLAVLLSDVKRQDLATVALVSADLSFVSESELTSLTKSLAAFGQVRERGTEPANCIAFGSALMHGVIINCPAQFVVVAYNDTGSEQTEGGDKFMAYAVSRAGSTPVAFHDAGTGVYHAEFTPTAQTAHVAVKLRGKHIGGSPFALPLPCIDFRGSASTILTPLMQQQLMAMFLQKPVALRLVLGVSAGFDEFSSVVFGQGPILLVARNTTGHVFGFMIYDSLGEGKARWIPGHANNFHFRIGGEDGPLKLLRNALATQRRIGTVWTGESTSAATSDMETLVGDGVNKDGTPYKNTCKAQHFTTVAPGYKSCTVTDTTLAGAAVWTPDRIEVYSLEM